MIFWKNCLPDPVGQIIARWNRPNGLYIEQVRTPLGVIGVICESRPCVTAEAAALCLKGNAVVLCFDPASFYSVTAIHAAVIRGLEEAGLPSDIIQTVNTADGSALDEMFKGLSGAIDMIIPCGSRRLVAYAQENACIPVLCHLKGLCHIYIDQSAETLLVDRAAVGTHLVPVLRQLAGCSCEIRATEEVQTFFANVCIASDKDWHTEYLDAVISVKLVDGVDEAIRHINLHSSGHTESVIAQDMQVVDKFLDTIDSAILVHNASTQFADGGEFGFGAEMCIATGRIHARGPIGVEQLTSFKYHVRGSGQVRP